MHISSFVDMALYYGSFLFCLNFLLIANFREDACLSGADSILIRSFELFPMTPGKQ